MQIRAGYLDKVLTWAPGQRGKSAQQVNGVMLLRPGWSENAVSGKGRSDYRRLRAQRATPDAEGRRSHLLLSRKGPSVLGQLCCPVHSLPTFHWF